MMYIVTKHNDTRKRITSDFFDMDFNSLPIKSFHENSGKKIEPFDNFEKMKDLANKISQDIPHVRVDFYNVDNHIYFSEMAFYNFAGLAPIEPQEYDELLGSWIKLPKIDN